MYYPIIDKLKDLMDEIGQGGGGALVINGELTSDTAGTWEGTISDIKNALTNGTSVILKVIVNGVSINHVYINSFSIPDNYALGFFGSFTWIIKADNTFTIS